MQLHLTPNGVSYLSINVIHTLPEKEETRLKAVNLPDVKTIKITSYKITPILHRSAFPVYGSTKMRIVYKSHSPKFNTYKVNKTKKCSTSGDMYKGEPQQVVTRLCEINKRISPEYLRSIYKASKPKILMSVRRTTI